MKLTFMCAMALVFGASDSLAQEVTLTEQDILLLKRIDSMEKAAGVIKGALFFSGISASISSSPVELAYNVSQLDLGGLAEGMSNTEKIKRCSISDAIEIHLLDSPASQEFWEAIQKPYKDGC